MTFVKLMNRLVCFPRHKPSLDPSFIPAVLWNRAYEDRVARGTTPVPLALVLEGYGGDISRFDTHILPPGNSDDTETVFYVERILKFLLWQKGAFRVHIAGPEKLVQAIRVIYSAAGARQFDSDFIGQKLGGQPLEIKAGAWETLPAPRENHAPLGRNWNGCRIGFDLGGSDRKCVAMIDGKVIFSEEIPWDPYFQKNAVYHYNGIQDSLKRAAAHLPRVDAIGGSAAGIYVNNEVRAGSLFRGIGPEEFDREVRPIFQTLKRAWGGVPFEVINDGEVTALAGSISLEVTGILGVSLGTSQAGGFVNAEGNITTWLNELAFAPVDYSRQAAVDEWSGDRGCGVQYFSQQAVGRLARKAGIVLPPEMPLPEKLVEVQKWMEKGDERARAIYETIGTYLGYTIAHYERFYDFRHLLILGRVTSGPGGEVILAQARRVLADEFPKTSERMALHTPNEKEKRHGQAMAAATLPKLLSS